MRWIIVVGGLALMLMTTAGCKQQCYMTECDFNHYKDIMPLALENNKPFSILPPGPIYTPDPANTDDPDRPIRYLSLAEAIAIALERGNIGEADPNRLLGIQGIRGAGVASDNIRVLALNPAIAGATIELALSKFDAVWNTSITWNNTDRPVGTPLDTFQAQNQVNAIEQQEATFTSSILKPLPTGGVAGITFTTDYQFTNLPARVNPSYRPALQFQFEQPLLQGYGVEINQIRARHPGNLFTPGRLFNLQPTQEGVLITRLRFDQERAEFERRVNLLLLNVESAYWTLYGAYMTLFAQEQGLRAAYEAWKISYENWRVGRIPDQQLAQARAQYEIARSQRLAALGSGGGGGGLQPLIVQQQPGVLEAERQLRGVLNLPPSDGYRLVPCDSPTLAPYKPDWNTALNEALALRPELIMARQEVKTRQLNLIEAKNNLLPDLRAFATYDINGIGNRLDGAQINNTFRSLASDHFNNWQLGLNLNYPFGYRQAYASVRIARLQLAQSYALLKEQELRAARALDIPYRRITELYAQISILRAQRQEIARVLQAALEIYRAGSARAVGGEQQQLAGTLAAVLQAQQTWANALSSEINFIIQYNIELANFEFNKGTIMQHNNVQIAEGPLPKCAQVRAVEHERERTKALVLATRPNPDLLPSCCPDGCGTADADGAPPLPAVLNATPPLPKLPPPEQLKMPQPINGNPPKPADTAPLPTPLTPARPETERSLPLLRGLTPPAPPAAPEAGMGR
jgi:outer membrane protein TolC